MTGRQDALARILAACGFRAVVAKTVASPSMRNLPQELRPAVLDVYRRLGGVLDAPNLRTGKWDIIFEDGLLVELDEHQHFHRYRASTLATAWARRLPWCADYLDQCTRYEDNYQGERRIGFWTNRSAERMFGPAGPIGEMDGPGAPRGRQRACYDAMKDILAAHGHVRLARLSIYDEVGGAMLGHALLGRAHLDPAELVGLLTAWTVDPSQL